MTKSEQRVLELRLTSDRENANKGLDNATTEFGKGHAKGFRDGIDRALGIIREEFGKNGRAR